MGTSVVGTLTPEQAATLPGKRADIAAAGIGGTATNFRFFAGFDGTNNSGADLTLSGNKSPTNVYQLVEQAEQAKTGEQTFVPKYYAGVGTGEERGNIVNAAVLPTGPVNAVAEKAYNDFVKAASEYLSTVPGATISDITVSVASFSRGGPTATAFAWLINDRGLIAPNGEKLAEPGSILITGGMAYIDPVSRFVEGNQALPPIVKGPVVVVVAENENRSDFRPDDLSGDTRVTVVTHPGNHTGNGGGNDRNGTGANVLEGLTGFFQKVGNPIADVPAENRFDSTQLPKIYTEDYQVARNGDVLLTRSGGEFTLGDSSAPALAWRLDDSSKPRLTVPTGSVNPQDSQATPEPTNPVTGNTVKSDFRLSEIKDYNAQEDTGTTTALDGSDAHFNHHPATETAPADEQINAVYDTTHSTSLLAPAASPQPAGVAPLGGVGSIGAPPNGIATNPSPEWLTALQNSGDAGTKEVARLMATSDFATTFDQIQHSPTLQQDIVEFVTGTGRFEGRELGRLSTDGINAGAGAYSAGDNTVRIAPDRLQGVDIEGNQSRWPDGAAVIGHEVQHAYNRADVNQLPTQSDPNFSNATSPPVVWNNLLDEAEGQLRQYRIAKEIYDHEGWSYEVDPFQARPQLSMGDSVPYGQDKDARAQRIEQWLDDGAELYRHGLIPSSDYLARANLAVEIGNDHKVSVEGGSTNYIDYYANLGKPTQDDPQRMQHVEITGIENGKISVTFSSAGDEARLVRLTQPVDAGAEGPWNAEVGRRIPVNESGTQAPAPVGASEIEIIKTVSSDGKGNTTVTDNSSNTTTTDGSDAHLTHYPPPSASDDSSNGSTSNQPVALVEPAQPATNTVATNTLTNAQVEDLSTSLGLANTLIALRNWGSQTDLSHLSTAVNLYNQLDHLGTTFGGSGNNLPADLGQFGAGIGMITALQSGNPISIASSGAALYNSFASATNAIPIPFIAVLNIGNALQSGDPFAIAASVAACFPPWGTVASIVISIIGSMVHHDIPPPPDGSVHYTWDETGAIQIQTDHNVSGGAKTATSTAGNMLTVLQSVVSDHNAKNDTEGHSEANLGIDPSRMPTIGFTAGMSWLEITHADGSTTKETINPATIGERLLQIAVQNDALAPEWQIQTAQAHARTAHAQAVQTQLDAEATHAQAVHDTEVFNANAADGQTRTVPLNPNASTAVDIDGHTSAAPPPVQVNLHNNAAVFGTEGKVQEAADHKTQTFSALVVHLHSPTAQDAIAAIADTKTNTVLQDVDGDGFWEQTQWVAGKDDAGNAQGMLVLDHNNNRLIEAADILHLGGNSNERNSLAWLDANGDGKLDAHDPAFAAIKLFVDINNNGRVDDGEMQSPQLSSINFSTGQINYTEGPSATLSATTLQGDTEGIKAEQVKVVGADGKLHEIDAGIVLVHEGYEGQVRVNSKGQIVADDDPATDTHLVGKRTNSYEQEAKRVGDWEGTADQELHRHGGGNVAGAPTETSATGAISMGAVLGKENAITYTTMEEGDKRICILRPNRTAVERGLFQNTVVNFICLSRILNARRSTKHSSLSERQSSEVTRVIYAKSIFCARASNRGW